MEDLFIFTEALLAPIFLAPSLLFLSTHLTHLCIPPPVVPSARRLPLFPFPTPCSLIAHAKHSGFRGKFILERAVCLTGERVTSGLKPLCGAAQSVSPSCTFHPDSFTHSFLSPNSFHALPSQLTAPLALALVPKTFLCEIIIASRKARG